MDRTIKILLVDDHQMVRQALRALLGTQPALEVVAEADDGRAAVRLVAELSPDVVLMDVEMPELNGVDATRRIVSQRTGTKVIGLSGHADRRLITQMLKAGVSGYVLKEGGIEELVVAIHAAVAGKVHLSPAVAGAVAEEFAKGGTAGACSAFAKLSPREREVLQLVAEGKATKEVAAHLHVSVKTVETHRRKIMEKLDLYSVAELTKYALREGITSLDTQPGK